MIIVDGHQDLAWNMRSFNRDYTRAAVETRRLELGMQPPLAAGDTLLGWPDYQEGCVAVIFAALFAAPHRCASPGSSTQIYTDSRHAGRLYRGQVEAYLRLQDEHPGKFRLIGEADDLSEVLAAWQSNSVCAALTGVPAGVEKQTDAGMGDRGNAPDPGNPVGLVLLMEGAEGVQSPPELEEWWALGVRLIGPAWMSNQYTGGTDEPGPLTGEGFELLEVMADLGFGLDLSHMDDTAALQALNYFPGTILATHTAAAALHRDSSNRFVSDRVIRGLIEREGVMGVPLVNPLLVSSWRPSDGRHAVTLDHVVAQIDYVCQIAGDARHVALGTDFDGGFGVQMVPAGINTAADLKKLVPELLARGYTEEDTADVMGQNWLRVLEKVLT